MMSRYLLKANYVAKSYFSAMATALKPCIVDLRSDTFTKPSIAMREAIFHAIVGDDVEDEDPTVNEFQEKVANLTGKENALYVTSGTMGNLLAVLSHCTRRGSEVVLGDQSHIYMNEQGNIAQFGGVQSQIIPNKPDGTFDLKKINVHSTANDFHTTTTELICIENTHNNVGGKVLPISWLKELRKFSKENGLPVHMDGARLFNASIKSGVPVAEILDNVDTAQICFSKGLGAPVGSIIVGSNDFIRRAKNLRKAIGGGWRQAGMIAAGALYALENNIERMSVDHHNAQLLREGINNMKSNKVKIIHDVDTNIVLLELEGITPEEFSARLVNPSVEEVATNSNTIVKCYSHTATSVRLVTHLDVSESDVQVAIKKIVSVVKDLEA